MLRCFTAARRELGTSEIARLLGLPQPTVWRLCRTLQDEGYLLPGQGGDRLQLSPAVLGLGYSALASTPIADIARPAMQELASRFGAACSMGIRNGLQLMLIQRCQGHSDLILNLHIGSQLSLASSASGAAYIANLPAADRNVLLDEIRSSDPATWPAREAVIASALRQYAEYGFVMDCGGYHPRISTAAVAFTGVDGQSYSLSCGAPAEQLTLDTLRREIGPEQVRLAAALSAHR